MYLVHPFPVLGKLDIRIVFSVTRSAILLFKFILLLATIFVCLLSAHPNNPPYLRRANSGINLENDVLPHFSMNQRITCPNKSYGVLDFIL